MEVDEKNRRKQRYKCDFIIEMNASRALWVRMPIKQLPTSPLSPTKKPKSTRKSYYKSARKKFDYNGPGWTETQQML